MIEILVSCFFPMVLTTDIIPEYRECIQVQENIIHVSKHTEMLSRYFKYSINISSCFSFLRNRLIVVKPSTTTINAKIIIVVIINCLTYF